MLRLRMDRRISARFDEEDVLQEIFIQLSQSLWGNFPVTSDLFYVWLRGIAMNVLLEHHRRHLGTHKRDARLEISLQRQSALEASSHVLANYLAASGTSPSDAAMADELRSRLESLIDSMDPIDKEVLALRHFEQLSPHETAEVLQIQEKAAGMRYIRALKRLKHLMADTFGESTPWSV